MLSWEIRLLLLLLLHLVFLLFLLFFYFSYFFMLILCSADHGADAVLRNKAALLFPDAYAELSNYEK